MLNKERVLLPADVVFAPDWWHRNAGITFDEDFFYHPVRRVEVERRMERELYERWGRYGLGRDCDRDVPLVGAVHLAAGFMIPEMLGCRVDYRGDAPPQVHAAGIAELAVDIDAAFESPAFRRFAALCDVLEQKYGYVAGDVNWGGILNIAMDLRGQDLFVDMLESGPGVRLFFGQLGSLLERFAGMVSARTGSSSISVNRNVRNLAEPVFLHSECSHTMISEELYREFLLPYDCEWSVRHRPFGIHYCGADPHRYAESYAQIPHLDFLDVGWGGDLRRLRGMLPETFLNIRLSPVELVRQTPEQIRSDIFRLVAEAGGPARAGVCCINIDRSVSDEQVTAIFEAVAALRSAGGCR